MQTFEGNKMEGAWENGLEEVGGKVSPLGLQLQKAYLQTQILKAQKQSLPKVLVNNDPLQGSLSDMVSPFLEQSMLEPQTPILPEVAQPLLSFVIEDDKALTPSCSRIIQNTAPLVNSFMNRGNFANFDHHVQQSFSSTSGFEPISSFLDIPTIDTNASHISHLPSDVHSFDMPTFSTRKEKKKRTTRDVDIDPLITAEELEERLPLLSYLNSLEDLHEDFIVDEFISQQVQTTDHGVILEGAKEHETLISYNNEGLDNELQEDSYDHHQVMAQKLGVFTAPFHDEEPSSFHEVTNAEVDDKYTMRPSQFETAQAPNHDFSNDVEFGNTMTSILDLFDNGDINKDDNFNSNLIQNSSNEAQMLTIELTTTLLRCAQAIETKDFKLVIDLIEKLQKHATPFGNAIQRLAHYFKEALVAKISGTGKQLFTKWIRPSTSGMVKMLQSYMENVPLLLGAHCFANNTLMEAFKGATHVHVVHYGIMYGIQWPSFMYMLSQRPEGPPHLRITGIDQPEPGFKPTERIQDIGQRLGAVAHELKIPFEFHAIADKWEAVTPTHLFLRKNEVLGVNCILTLRNLMDESVVATSPRNSFLRRIRSMNPKVFVQAVINARYNTPFFVPRFQAILQEALVYFDMMENAFSLDPIGRTIMESQVLGRSIFNVVACDGLDRVDRPGLYIEWDSRNKHAGFTHLPENPTIVAKLKAMFNTFHQDFGIDEDKRWLLGKWKGHTLHAYSAWKLAATDY